MTEPQPVQGSRLDWSAPSRAAHPARDAAMRSYAAVIAKDKDAWLANFADDGVIEDPVGPSMFDATGEGHRTAEQRANFWDMTIGTMTRFVFEIRDSFACGLDECANVGTIHTTMGDGATASTDGVFVYRVDAEGRILSLRAFWELERTLSSYRAAGGDANDWGPAGAQPGDDRQPQRRHSG